MAWQRICQGVRRKDKLSPRTAQKLCCKVNIKPRVLLKDVAKSLDTMGINHTIQHFLNRNKLHGNQPWRMPLHRLGHI